MRVYWCICCTFVFCADLYDRFWILWSVVLCFDQFDQPVHTFSILFIIFCMLVCLYAAGSEESQLSHLLQMHTQRYSKCFHCLFVQGFVQHIAERMHSWDFRMHMLKLLTLFRASAHSWVMQLSSAILVQLDWSPCLPHFATMRDRACSVQLVFPIFLYFRSICQTNSHPFCDLWQHLVQSSTFRFRLVNSSGPLTVSSGMVHGTRLRPVVEVSGHVRTTPRIWMKKGKRGRWM